MSESNLSNRLLRDILHCVQRTDGQVGLGGIAKILQGRRSRKLRQYEFDHLHWFGLYAKLDRKVIIEHIDWLIEKGCIVVGSLIFFPRLQLTEAGKNRLESLAEELRQEVGTPAPREVEVVSEPEIELVVGVTGGKLRYDAISS